MMMIIGPRHSRGAHDFRAPLAWRTPMRVFFQGGNSVDSWTPGPKPLCHRHPTGPHPSGLLWTPAKGDPTKSNLALAARIIPSVARDPSSLRAGECRDLRQEGAFGRHRRQAGVGGPGVEAAVGVLGVVGLVEIVREEVEQA